MKVVELFGVSAVDSPCLTGIEKSGEYHCTIDLQLGGKAESSPLPNILTESPKGNAGLGNPVIDLSING